MEAGFTRRRLLISLLLSVLVAAFLGGALAGGLVSLLARDSDGADAGPSLGQEGPLEAAPDLQDAVAEAVAAALPSVVTVINEIAPSPEFPEGGIGGGAGFIFDDSEGLILTNEHIVRSPGKLSVLLNGGEVRPATIVSDDAPFTDLAVIRIAPAGLEALSLADSDDLVPGQTVIAIGSPDIDYSNSVSVGVVSGRGRRKQLNGVWLEDLIQTDAAINTGSSGGPLLNLRGEVVGVVTFRDVGAADPLFGISFAISSRTFLPIVRSIQQGGAFPRPYFGIDYETVVPAFAAANELGVEDGAYVSRVVEASPAAKAGIRAGDVILRIGETDLGARSSFIDALAAAPIDASVPVLLWRGGQAEEVVVEVTAR